MSLGMHMKIRALQYIAASEGLDASGECGSLVHYAFILAFVGSAFLAFLYLWKKGKLDMDEEPKIRMMEEDQGDLDKLPPENKGDDGEE